MTSKNYADLIVFHDDLQVMEVDFSHQLFENSAMVNAFYDEIDQQISATGKRWYFLVNYKKCEILPEAWIAFAARGKTVNMAYSMGTVRFDARDDTEATILEKSETENFDPNLFTSRAAALNAIAVWRDKASVG